MAIWRRGAGLRWQFAKEGVKPQVSWGRGNKTAAQRERCKTAVWSMNKMVVGGGWGVRLQFAEGDTNLAYP